MTLKGKIMNLTTESPSHYDDLEQLPVRKLLEYINEEDKTVPFAVERAIPQIERFVVAACERMNRGGRLFYIGAGTSGRLGVLDASEIPPTFGAPADWVTGIIAGGDHALRNPIEFAEDNEAQAWEDLAAFQCSGADIVVGIAASGTTPYVLGGLEHARRIGALTGCIVCNAGTPIAAAVEYPIEIPVGPEFITGSTRMKSGTATKLALNMISTR